MAFTRDDLVAYATKPQVDVPGHDPFNPSPQGAPANVEADVNAAIDASLSESAVTDINDGSTTELEAEPVAAEIANPEGANSPELDDPLDGGRRSRAQERIEELVAERNALREYGKYLLKQVEGVRTPSETVSQPVAAPVEEEQMPTLESADFDPSKFSKMQNEWVQKQVNKRVEQAVKQIEVRQSEQATRQAFESKVAEFRKNAPDFDTVLSNPALPRLAERAAKEVIHSERGPAIAYHLGKNPDLAARIARMDPDGQIKAIGRLEEQLSKSTQQEPSTTVAKPAQKQASVTKAPPPPKPVTSGTGVISKPENIMGMDEWVQNERNKKIAEKSARVKMRNAMR